MNRPLPSRSDGIPEVDRIHAEVFGRQINVAFGDLDESGQFSVSVFVDTKMVYEASFTDKSEDR